MVNQDMQIGWKLISYSPWPGPCLTPGLLPWQVLSPPHWLRHLLRVPPASLWPCGQPVPILSPDHKQELEEEGPASSCPSLSNPSHLPSSTSPAPTPRLRSEPQLALRKKPTWFSCLHPGALSPQVTFPIGPHKSQSIACPSGEQRPVSPGDFPPGHLRLFCWCQGMKLGLEADTQDMRPLRHCGA